MYSTAHSSLSIRSGDCDIMVRTRWSPASAMSGPMSTMMRRSRRPACAAAYWIAIRPPMECPSSAKRSSWRLPAKAATSSAMVATR